VPPDRFRRQLEGLLAKGYRPVPLSEAIECHRSGKSLPPRAFVVTFDDACESVYQCALPVLETFGIPATVFVATAYLDSDAAMPFDNWRAAGWPGVPPVTWRTMTTEQCLDAQQGGLIELACHTHTHADFRGRPEAFAEDLSLSLNVFQERFGVRKPALAFPGGANEPAMLAVAKRLGLTCSLTTLSQRADLRADPHGWGRFTAELFDTAATLSAKVSGWYDLLLGRGGRHGSTMTGLGESSTDVERAGGRV
jgi:peptidoglycan/xylan/chitin deacetylase (PgdA/CDA1 family)